MKKSGPRKMVLPAITVIGVVVILGLILSTSIYQNLDRQRRLIIRVLNEKGSALIVAIQSMAASSAQQGLTPSLVPTLNSLIANAGVEELALYRPDFSPLVTVGEPQPLNIQATLGAAGSDESVKKTPAGRSIFEMVRPFDLGWLSPDENRKGYIQLCLSMAEVEQAERDDLNYTIFLGLILLAVGTAAFYFIFVTQNYYLVNRTLRTIRSYADNLVESLADGLISFDQYGHVVTINHAGEELLEATTKDAVNKPLTQILDEEANEEFFSLLARSGGRLTRELTLVNRHGVIIPVSVSRSQIVDGESGEPIGSLALLHNLSELRQLQSQVRRSERLASLGRLAAAVAHEIRNPLNAIRGFTQFLQEKFPENAQERYYTRIMINEIDRLDSVIRGMLEFTRPMEPHVQPEDIGEVVKNSIEFVLSDAATQNVQIEVGIDPGLPLVAIDGPKMKQVLLNLMLNAITAMPEGGTLSIRVHIRTDPPERSHLIIELEDTGIGIKPEDLDKIFEPFFTTRPGGTGLGLSTAHRIVENHDGAITVFSEPGAGSRFIVDIPVQTVKPEGVQHD